MEGGNIKGAGGHVHISSFSGSQGVAIARSDWQASLESFLFSTASFKITCKFRAVCRPF